MLYEAILQIHTHVYQFFRRKGLEYLLIQNNSANHELGWRILFDALWPRTLSRCTEIISHVQNSSALLQQEELADHSGKLHNSIVELSKSRVFAQQEQAEKETRSALAKYQSVLSWLNVDPSEQSDILNTLTTECYPGTCNWILKHKRFQSWLADEKQSILWISGKPGSGTELGIKLTYSFLTAGRENHSCEIPGSEPARR